MSHFILRFAPCLVRDNDTIHLFFKLGVLIFLVEQKITSILLELIKIEKGGKYKDMYRIALSHQMDAGNNYCVETSDTIPVYNFLVRLREIF